MVACRSTHPQSIWLAGLTVAVAASTPGVAAAYVGPGAGLTMLASLLAVGAAALIMVIGLIAFPLRLMMKAARRRRAEGSASETSED